MVAVVEVEESRVTGAAVLCPSGSTEEDRNRIDNAT